jgi:hypothetical protein
VASFSYSRRFIRKINSLGPFPELSLAVELRATRQTRKTRKKTRCAARIPHESENGIKSRSPFRSNRLFRRMILSETPQPFGIMLLAFWRMILSDKSATFRDHALGVLEHDLVRKVCNFSGIML